MRCHSKSRLYVSVEALIWLVLLLGWIAGANVALAGPIAYNLPNLFGAEAVDVHLINPDGTGDRRVSPQILLNGVPAGEAASLARPVWSRDGQLIAANGVIGGAATKILVVFDPVTEQGISFTTWPTTLFELFKAFSPDGQRVAFANVQLNFA